MTATIRLRPIVKEDLDLLFRIYASTREEEMAQVPWSNSDKDKFLRMQFQLQTDHYEKHYPQARFEIILLDEEPAGRLYVDRRDKEIRIVDIALLPSFRGQGIGSSLLHELIEESDNTGKPVSIHVEQYNPAKRLYERLGFRPIGEVGVYDLMERPVAPKVSDA